jgi:hypothetical protein
MISAAEQYRALVNRLEAIQEAQQNYKMGPNGELVPQDEYTADVSANGSAPAQPDDAAGVDAAVAANASNDALLKQIENASTFNQAYAMAKKAGLKKFKWCQCKEYAVQDAAPQRPQGGSPTPPQQLDTITGTPLPLPAATGNPTQTNKTDPNNKNIAPGSLRDRATRMPNNPSQGTVGPDGSYRQGGPGESDAWARNGGQNFDPTQQNRKAR